MIGRSIGQYTIVEKIGEGGMGEVYRATDSVLKRDIALKFLPESMAQDETARRRFLREARSAAALDHPFICQIHEIGEIDGSEFIAMEYVSGQTLKHKLTEGRLPIPECLRIASEIAKALDKAQEKGIVHRDLKPSNIMLTSDGHVKLMDFGLAKRASGAQEDTQEVSVTKLTREGSTLGTVPYMSPEQLKGEEVDSRSDIFSFGIILYEMLAGVHPFIKPDVMATASSILQEEPPPLALHREGISPVIQYMVRKMLAKDSDRRYQLIHDVKTDLAAVIDEIEHLPFETREAAKAELTKKPTASTATLLTRRKWQPAAPWAAGVLLAGIASIAVWNLKPVQPPPTSPEVRTVIEVEHGRQLIGRIGPSEGNYGFSRPSRTAMALSPDGQYLVYSAGSEDHLDSRLYLRKLDQLGATPIPGTEGSVQPFFSPEGQWVGFHADGKLKKVSLSGDPPITLCEEARPPVGASWGEPDIIMFGRRGSGLWQVPASGGTPEQLTTPHSDEGELAHGLPEILPGEKAVLYTAMSSRTQGGFGSQIVVQSLESGERRVLVEGADPRYTPTGHLVYIHNATLMAVPFDLDRLDITGSPVSLIEDVAQAINASFPAINTGAAQFSFSKTGSLVYASGGIVPDRVRSLVWLDRKGSSELIKTFEGGVSKARLSPDGLHIAHNYSLREQSSVWTYNLLRGNREKLTLEGRAGYPTWTRDGKWLTYALRKDELWKITHHSVDGSKPKEELKTSEHNLSPASWTRHGQLAYIETHPTTGEDIWVLRMEDRKAEPFLNTNAGEAYPDFSPDGRWLAYTSNESGRSQVYVQPYPPTGKRWVISTEVGRTPLWAPNGRELFYLTVPTRKLMVVDISIDPTFTHGTPRVLFDIDQSLVFSLGTRNWDISPDGRRFLMIKRGGQAPHAPQPLTEMIFVQSWFEELKRRVPTDY